MIEVGRIGFNLTITGSAVKKLKDFKDATDSAISSGDILGKTLGYLCEQVERLSAAFSSVNPLFSDFNSQIIKGSTKLGGYATKTGILAENFRKIEYNAKGASGSIKGFTETVDESKAPINFGGRGRGGEGRGGGGHSFAHILGHEAGGGAAGGFLAGRFLGGTSMIGLGAALGTIMLGKASYEASTRFQQAKVQFAGQGFGSQANALATNAALGMNIKGVSTTEALQAINDAATVTRNVPKAIALAPEIAKMEYANKINYAQKGKQFSNADEMRMLQFAELRTGSTDPSKFLPALDLIEKTFASDAARLSTNDLRTFGRQGSSFLHNLSDRGFIEISPLMQSLGGARTATGLTTMQTSLEKGQNLRTGKKAVAEFERLGIYKDGKIDPKYLQQLTQTPIDFIYDTLMPAMKKKGIQGEANVSAELSVLFTQSVTRVIQQAISQEPRISAQLGLVPKASGIEAGYLSASSTNPGHVKNIEAAWDSMMTAIGKFSSPVVNKGMDLLTEFFSGIAKLLNGGDAMKAWDVSFATKHPFLARLGGYVNPPNTNNFSANTASAATSKAPMYQITHTTNLEGTAIARTVTYHQAQALAAPQIGTTQFNAGSVLGFTSPSYAGQIR